MAKRQRGRKALLKEFYRQIMMHGFALGYAAMGGSYLEGLQIASGPLHSAAIELAANEMAEKEMQEVKSMAMGGLVTQPTFALLGEAGPEMVVPLSSPPKRKRKKTDYDKRLKRALLEVNKTARLKNGSFRKGWDMSKVMKKAHKLARKYGPSTKKGQVRKTARRAYKR
jgi:SLT domain-containing protein